MSTFDSTLNAASSFVVKDIYQRWFRSKAKDKELIRVAWITTACTALVGFLAGPACSFPTSSAFTGGA
jgi:Na+/proline symporter